LAWCPIDPITAEHAHPGVDGLLVHTHDHRDLRETLAVHDGEDAEQILDLAPSAQLPDGFQLPFHVLAVLRGEGKTDAAHRDIPPKTPGERCFFSRYVPDVWRLVNPSSDDVFLKVYSSYPYTSNKRVSGNQSWSINAL